MAGDVLKDRVAVITGGSRGIGQAIAWAFADEGADVGVIGRDEAALAETVAGIERRCSRATQTRARSQRSRSLAPIYRPILSARTIAMATHAFVDTTAAGYGILSTPTAW